MKPKSEIRILEARNKSEIRKRKSAAQSEEQTLQSEGTDGETSWLQSSDFFRNLDLALRISAESTSLKQFNSEF